MIIIKSIIKVLSLPLVVVMVLAGLILRLTAHLHDGVSRLKP